MMFNWKEQTPFFTFKLYNYNVEIIQAHVTIFTILKFGFTNNDFMTNGTANQNYGKGHAILIYSLYIQVTNITTRIPTFPINKG